MTYLGGGLNVGNSWKIYEYTGTPTATLDDGYCKIQKIDFGTFKLVKVVGWFKANGTISTSVELTPIFTFDSGIIESGMSDAVLTYGKAADFCFCRITCQSSNDSVNVFYGTTVDSYYSFDGTFIITPSV